MTMIANPSIPIIAAGFIAAGESTARQVARVNDPAAVAASLAAIRAEQRRRRELRVAGITEAEADTAIYDATGKPRESNGRHFDRLV